MITVTAKRSVAPCTLGTTWSYPLIAILTDVVVFADTLFIIFECVSHTCVTFKFCWPMTSCTHHMTGAFEGRAVYTTPMRVTLAYVELIKGAV